MIVLDAGTTWSKIIETSSEYMKNSSYTPVKVKNGCYYYVIPSQQLDCLNFKFDYATGHMSLSLLKDKQKYENEIIALIKGFQKTIRDENCVILDMGSRDSKWVMFKQGQFKDLNWNNNCSSSTGATVEMLLKFYNKSVADLSFTKEKYPITCAVFGLEKIMDDIAKGNKSEIAISKFIHGIAYNAWSFAKMPSKIYLSGGFCENKCFTDSLNYYCETIPLGRFMLAEGLLNFNI